MKARTLEALDREHFTDEEIEEIRAEAMLTILELNLKAMREQLELTQVELAQRLDMSQAQVSQIENRADLLISTLRRYTKALGGEIELHAVFGDKRVKLTGL